MSKSSRSNGPALNRRELLRLSTAAGVGAVMPTYGAFAEMKGARPRLPRARAARPVRPSRRRSTARCAATSRTACSRSRACRTARRPAARIGGCRRSLPRRGTASTRL